MMAVTAGTARLVLSIAAFSAFLPTGAFGGGNFGCASTIIGRADLRRIRRANRAHWSIRSLISHRCTRNQSNNRAEDTRAMEGNGIRSSDGGSRRWDAALEPLLGAPTGALWRLHSDAVNAKLFARWLPRETCADLLKTDLFDEAMGSGLYPLLSERARRVAALDLAPSVLAAATMRHPALLAVTADVRRLPFASDAFDVVVSNSTLDHFDTRDEILASLRGFHRVLRPGGRLLLTMDNLANPAVALRNALPYRLLHRLKLVAYPIGATGGPGRLRRMLNDAGFEVLETAALLHCPRALSVALARRCERRGTSEATARFLRAALRWERLARWPTRFLTGYFVGLHARKP
jgi:SAM-dependent methyltransferase